MSAVPQQLLSLPKVKGLKGVDTRIHRIYPTNASGATEFVPEGGLNRIIFSIPAYKNGFYNPQRSFFHFKAKTNAVTTNFNAGLPVINRMVLRTGNGMLIEDIQDYSVIQRILSNFEDESVKRGRGAMTGDLRANFAATDVATLGAAHAAGKTFTHDLLSGVIGKRQQHYIPVGLFNATGGFSFELELHLEKATVACSSSAPVPASGATEVNYSLSDVSLQMEIVTLPSTVTDRLNSELQSDNKVQIPFSTFRLHQSHFPSGSTSVDVNISEHAHDLETIYTVLREQTTLVRNITAYGYDNLEFQGGSGATTKLKSYQWRYDTKYYPDAKAEMATNDASLALYNAVHTLDMADKPVFAAIDGYWDNAGMCCIVQSFKASRDDFLNSLNSSSTGAPVELQIAVKSALVNALRIDSFCKSNYTLNVMKGGQTTILNGSVKDTN